MVDSDQCSVFLFELVGSLVGDESDSVFVPAEAGACACGVVELLPDDDADAGCQHEKDEEGDEADDLGCADLGREAVEG